MKQGLRCSHFSTCVGYSSRQSLIKSACGHELYGTMNNISQWTCRYISLCMRAPFPQIVWVQIFWKAISAAMLRPPLPQLPLLAVLVEDQGFWCSNLPWVNLQVFSCLIWRPTKGSNLGLLFMESFRKCVAFITTVSSFCLWTQWECSLCFWPRVRSVMLGF